MSRTGLLFLIVVLPACGDPSCPTGYVLNAAKTLCVSDDAGVDATSEGEPDLGTDATVDLGTDATVGDLGADAGGCAAGHADCDSNGSCETDTTMDTANCGSCHHVCAYGACAASTCDVALQLTPGCARKGDGSVVCWGSNENGEVGDGTRSARPTAVPIAGLADTLVLASGQTTRCAVRADRTVNCWGANDYSQLGDGATHVPCSVATSTYDCSPTPVRVSGISDATGVAVGGDHVCATLPSSVTCWGQNLGGALGDGTTTSSSVPVTVVGLTDAIEIAVGGYSSCARRGPTGGSVVCWGVNAHGEIGDGTTTVRTTPTDVLGISDAISIAVGGYFGCAVRSDGRVSCWGDNHFGGLGEGSGTDHSTPVFVTGITDAVAVAAGNLHACALHRTGQISCWGSNAQAELGDGTLTDRPTPVLVSALTTAVAISASGTETCALLDDGAAYCWGTGPLGDPTATTSNVPLAVSTLH